MRYSILLILALLFVSSADAKSKQKTQDKETKATVAAYDAFNKALYDPQRMVYYRDTDGGKAIAVGWTQAIFWDLALNAYKKTGEKSYKNLVDNLYKGNYATLASFDWSDTKEWNLYDDMMWWVISFARAYEITGEKKYLAHSVDGFNRVWNGIPEVDPLGSFDPRDGGMYWDWKFGRRGKMACINYPTIIAAVTLFNITKDPVYLEKAKTVYKWSRENLFNPANGAVADSKHDGAQSAAWTMTLYNQATCIGAGAELFLATGEQQFLDDAILATSYVKNVMCDSDGIFPVERSGRSNPPTLDEKGVYRAIFAQYIEVLIQECGQNQFQGWIDTNIKMGWQFRDPQRDITAKNYTAQTPSGKAISVYDASGIPALMWGIFPVETISKRK